MTTIPTNREAVAREVLASIWDEDQCPITANLIRKGGDAHGSQFAIRAMLQFAALSTPAAAEGEVTQADRDVAAELMATQLIDVAPDDAAWSEAIRRAEDDTHPFVAAFSNHRRQSVAEAVEPWKDYHGDLPDYDHPLRCVYESGIQYAVDLLAKELGVEDWEVCDGTEEFDGDLGGTMMNIVCAALPTDEQGGPLSPREIRERFAALTESPIP